MAAACVAPGCAPRTESRREQPGRCPPWLGDADENSEVPDPVPSSGLDAANERLAAGPRSLSCCRPMLEALQRPLTDEENAGRRKRSARPSAQEFGESRDGNDAIKRQIALEKYAFLIG